MRTKTLLLTAALSAAGIATSMAQAVYSVNVVGYVNIQVPTGYSMIANQLNASPNNTLATVMPAPPDGTTIFKFDPGTGGYIIAANVDGAWEGAGPGTTLNPGEGAFIQAPSAFTATFVGEVKTGQSSTPLVAGYSIVSSQIPQAGLVSTDLLFPATEGDTVFQFVAATGAYVISANVDGAWEPAEPNLRVGEPFFLQNIGGASAWARNFVLP
jgi:hypothetical protein